MKYDSVRITGCLSVEVRDGVALVWTDAPLSFDWSNACDTGVRSRELLANGAVRYERLVSIRCGDIWAQCQRYMSGLYTVREGRCVADVLPANADIYRCAVA